MAKWSTGAICAAALVFYTTAFAQRPPIEFKGLAPGGDASVVTTHAAWNCRHSEIGGSDTVCTRRHETIAGADAALVMVGIKGGKIMSVVVSFSQKDFTAVLDALVLKYGPPDSRHTQVKMNRMGAKFSSLTADWRGQSTYMQIEERTSRVDSSVLFIGSQDSSKASEKQRAEQAEKNKTDL